MKRVILLAVRRIFRAWNIQIDHDGLLTAANDHRFHRLIFLRVEFLMWHVWRHVDEIARSGLVHKLQPISPSKTSAAAYDVNHRLDFSMMMGAGPGVWLHNDRSSPKFLGTHLRMRNSLRSRHPRRMRCVRIQLTGANNTQTVRFPIRFIRFIVAVLIAHDSLPALQIAMIFLCQNSANH